MVLRDASAVLARNGFHITVLSPVDGPVRKDFEQAGFKTLVDNKLSLEAMMQYDLIFANTMLWGNLIMKIAASGLPVLWWIHEAPIGIKSLVMQTPEIREIIANPPKNLHVFASMEYNQRVLKEYCGVQTEVLHFGLKDCRDEMKEGGTAPWEKVRFFLPASFGWIKGQDILTSAILMLPEDIRDRCEFFFTGGNRREDNIFWQCVMKLQKMLPETVHIFPEMSRDMVYAAYTMMDCVLSPSREDVTPSVIVEGMMFERICICSDHCGIADYMMDGFNGFVFERENVEELAARLQYVVMNLDKLEPMRKRGREIYDALYALKVFEKNLMSAVERAMG